MAKPRRKKDVTGTADETTGGVASDVIEKVRQDPNVMAVLPVASAGARQIEAWAGVLPVTNQGEYDVAADFLRQVKTFQKIWLDKFEEITNPLYLAWKAATTLRGEITQPADHAEVLLKEKMGVYLTAQAERQRQVDAERERAQLVQMQQVQPPQTPPLWVTQSSGYATMQEPATPRSQPQTQVPAPTQPTYHNPMAAIAAPRQAEGISTREGYEVHVSNAPNVVAFLISNGLTQVLSLLRPDDLEHAFEKCVNGDSDEAKMWRMMLSACPEIKVTAHTKIIARTY